MPDTDEPRGNRPALIARVKVGDGKFHRTIGAAWNFREGEGLVVTLDLIPTKWDGKFILVPPKEGGERED
jgi:hypothetical protein